MENNYIILNTSAEQRLSLAIIRIIRRLSILINNILMILEDKTDWLIEDSEAKETNYDLSASEGSNLLSAANKSATPDQSTSSEEAIQWAYPVFSTKRRKRQLNLDYLLAISG